MNIIFIFLGLITALYWLLVSTQGIRYMKNLPFFDVNDSTNNGAVYPSLSVVIPACNEEESIKQAVTQLLNQDYPNLEVIVVNDRSTDSTGEILANLKIQYFQLKVITIHELPPKWLGKNHAIHQGVKESTGEWLLFTDADVMFSPGSLKKTVSCALERKLDHLTIAPDICYGSVLYRAFVTYLGFGIISTVMVSKKVGMGAFNLVKKSVYDEIGGYEAVAMKVVDDMSFGALVVDKGYKQSWGLSGKGFIIVKWYDSLSVMFKGIEKNQFGYFKYDILGTLGVCLYLLLTSVYPFVGLFFGPLWARALCGVSVLCLFAIDNYLAKRIDISSSYVVFHPLLTLFYVTAILNSMVKTLLRGGVEWRGTVYSLEELRKNIF